MLEEVASQLVVNVESKALDLKNRLSVDYNCDASIKSITTDLMTLVGAKVLGYRDIYQKAQQLRTQNQEVARRLSVRVQPSQREVDFLHKSDVGERYDAVFRSVPPLCSKRVLKPMTMS